MAALAHNVTLNGYAAGHGGESLEPTEFLKLVIRYLTQARELEKLAGAEKILHGPDVRIAGDRRSAAHSGVPDARRLRLGPGARNGEPVAGFSYH